ncbi:MAG: DUF2059 domain-containing protein [Bacteroidia bacterium]|nr:DUF2059 domain-containing protein [Bacteroidia bacterium]
MKDRNNLKLFFVSVLLLIPVYKKHFTQEEVKAIVAFYETPAGKKLAEKTPMVTMESMQLSQTWAMSLMGKIQAYLN